MLLISFGKRRMDKSQKRVMTPEKMFRLTEFRGWQSNRVVKEFVKTETGSKLQSLIGEQLSELARLKKEKPITWETKAKTVTDSIAANRIKYIEELIEFCKKQKGVYKSTIELFEQQLREFKAGLAWLTE